MKIKKTLLFRVICLAVSIVLTCFNTCSRPKIKIETHTKTVSLKDTTTHSSIVPKPSRPTSILLPPDTFIKEVPYIDSAYCKQLAIAYFTENRYSQKLADDSIITAHAFYSISQNKMNDLRFVYKINRPQTINITTTTIEAEKPTLGFRIGAQITYLHDSLSVAPGVETWAGFLCNLIMPNNICLWILF